MDDDREFPSLMDDAEVLVELEKVEGEPLPPAVHARAPQEDPPIPLRRDINRYQLQTEGRTGAVESRRQAGAPPAAFADDAPELGAAGSFVPAFLTILIG